MFDKQLTQKLEQMLNQMTDSQKSKLAGILQNEESLKRALSGIDMEKARQVAQSLHVDGAERMDVDKLIEEAKRNPQLARKLDQIF